jgi:hypothetical protein
MFPSNWYAPRFYSRTYWPRPSVRIHDALLTDFLIVTGEDPRAPLPERALTVTAPDLRLAVEAADFVSVAPDRFVMVEGR